MCCVRKLDVTVLLHGHRVMPARTEVSHNALQRCATLGLVPNARVGSGGVSAGMRGFSGAPAVGSGAAVRC